jgi:hypothetical protein
MVYNDEAGAQYLYGGVDRLRANIATSQSAHAEASKRTATDRSIPAPGCRSLRGGSRSVSDCQSTSGKASPSACW